MTGRLNDPVVKIYNLMQSGSGKIIGIESLEAGDVLIEQGTAVGNIFLIEEGEIEVLIGDKRIGLFPAPALVGEMSLVFGMSVARVRATTKLFFKKVSHTALQDDEKRFLLELAQTRNKSNLENGRYVQKAD